MSMSTELPTIVLVEDDPAIADLVDMYLRRDGFRVYQARTGERGLEQIRDRTPELVILDIGLGGALDGLDVCRAIRRESTLPVIMLTARDGEDDRVAGLELGADDYLTKPFSPRELVARVRAILRRTQPDQSVPDVTDVYRAGSVLADTIRHEASIEGEPVPLTGKEFDLLVHFARNPAIALSRRQLIDAIWGTDFDGGERTVDVHIRQLRRKLGDAFPLTTVWGTGYRLDG